MTLLAVKLGKIWRQKLLAETENASVKPSQTLAHRAHRDKVLQKNHTLRTFMMLQ